MYLDYNFTFFISLIFNAVYKKSVFKLNNSISHFLEYLYWYLDSNSDYPDFYLKKKYILYSNLFNSIIYKSYISVKKNKSVLKILKTDKQFIGSSFYIFNSLLSINSGLIHYFDTNYIYTLDFFKGIQFNNLLLNNILFFLFNKFTLKQFIFNILDEYTYFFLKRISSPTLHIDRSPYFYSIGETLNYSFFYKNCCTFYKNLDIYYSISDYCSFLSNTIFLVNSDFNFYLYQYRFLLKLAISSDTNSLYSLWKYFVSVYDNNYLFEFSKDNLSFLQSLFRTINNSKFLDTTSFFLSTKLYIYDNIIDLYTDSYYSYGLFNSLLLNRYSSTFFSVTNYGYYYFEYLNHLDIKKNETLYGMSADGKDVNKDETKKKNKNSISGKQHLTSIRSIIDSSIITNSINSYAVFNRDSNTNIEYTDSNSIIEVATITSNAELFNNLRLYTKGIELFFLGNSDNLFLCIDPLVLNIMHETLLYNNIDQYINSYFKSIKHMNLLLDDSIDFQLDSVINDSGILIDSYSDYLDAVLYDDLETQCFDLITDLDSCFLDHIRLTNFYELDRLDEYKTLNDSFILRLFIYIVRIIDDLTIRKLSSSKLYTSHTFSAQITSKDLFDSQSFLPQNTDDGSNSYVLKETVQVVNSDDMHLDGTISNFYNSYWAIYFLYTDVYIQKFINFFMRDGKKKKAYSIFFKVLSKLKFLTGVSPTIIIKTIFSYSRQYFRLQMTSLNEKKVLKPYFLTSRQRISAIYFLFFNELDSMYITDYISVIDKLCYLILLNFFNISNNIWNEELRLDVETVYKQKHLLFKPVTKIINWDDLEFNNEHLVLDYKKKY